jgi:large conductance mechanosensitive channel
MLKEFKTFIMRGNVVDLAVAVIIGAAFSAIVGSLINDVITPLILKPAMKALHVDKLENLAWEGVLYGKFIASVINFIVTAFIIFIIIKALNKAKKKTEEKPTTEIAATKDQELLTEIRDLLKKPETK